MKTQTETDRTRKVILKGGDCLDVDHDDHEGVHTDAGCHAWDECEAFVVWHAPTGRWMTIPLD